MKVDTGGRRWTQVDAGGRRCAKVGAGNPKWMQMDESRCRWMKVVESELKYLWCYMCSLNTSPSIKSTAKEVFGKTDPLVITHEKSLKRMK